MLLPALGESSLIIFIRITLHILDIIVEKTCPYPDICTCKVYPDDKSCWKECMMRCARKNVSQMGE